MSGLKLPELDEKVAGFSIDKIDVQVTVHREKFL